MTQPRNNTSRLAAAALVMSFGVAGIALAENDARPGFSNAHGLRPDRPSRPAHPGLQSDAETTRPGQGGRCGTDSDQWSPDGPRLEVGKETHRIWSDQADTPRQNDVGDNEIEWFEAAIENPFGFETAEENGPQLEVGEESDRNDDWSADDLESDTQSTRPQGISCDPMDMNSDGKVDIEDFALLLDAFGTVQGDINRDGRTDGQDLGLMLARITAPVPND